MLEGPKLMNQAHRRLFLIRALLEERGESSLTKIPEEETKQRELLRALMNTRMPKPLTPDILAIQDAYLQQRLIERGGATSARTLNYRNRIALWRGDITLLAADAIVNAANDQMLGCFAPGHHCIDNAIHTFAGMQLRAACDKLMRSQGHPEPAGRVKVTPAFNLPSRFVFHTVGPIVANGHPSDTDELLLRQCYECCLRAAAERHLCTIAFCCISTGVFGYPQRDAARIAFDTVTSYLQENDPHLKVIFDVFLPSDEAIYRELLGANR